MEEPEFDITSQSDNLLLKKERKSRGGTKGERGASLWPQRQSLELTQRYLSKSLFAPIYMVEGEKPCSAPLLLNAAPHGFSAHGSSAMSCMCLAGLDEKWTPKALLFLLASEPEFG